MFDSTQNKKTSADVIRICANAPAGEMLVDSYERVVGTPTPQGYSELVLYKHTDAEARLVRCEDGGLDTECVTEYLVPIEAAYEALTVIADTDMRGWNRRTDTVGICGMSYVCRFRTADGGYVRVSSEQMPEDGVSAFTAVRGSMARLIPQKKA